MDIEGVKYIIVFILFAVLGFLFGGIFGWIVAALSLLVVLWIFFFLRDPNRTIPTDDDVVVSPADGKIIYVRENSEENTEVAIFMSPFDVHINRIPISGEVLSIKHISGKFHKAYTSKAHFENERVEILLKTGFGKILIKQIAGLIASRIVCRAREGEIFKTGQRFGLIKLGSRVELLFYNHINIIVKSDDRVRAGESILGRFTEEN